MKSTLFLTARHATHRGEKRWRMDIKGYFLTGDGYRCDPFTNTDAHSQFLIRCQAVVRMDLAQVIAVAMLRCASSACQSVFGPTSGRGSPVSS
jgi:hypothetical protein